MSAKKNLTIALDENLLLEARVVAARRRTSVNEMVRRHLETVVGGDRRRRAAWERVRALVEEPKGRIVGSLVPREELHER